MSLRFDYKGFPLDQSGDGGDSCVRAGIRAMCTGMAHGLDNYVLPTGEGVRHPYQQPWNNPKNFTKDQLKMLVAGLVACGRQDLVANILAHHRQLGYCQSSERDWPGSKKLMRPHAFYKDSKPYPGVIDPVSVPMEFSWRKFGFVVPEGTLDTSAEIETKLFDHADYMFPNDWQFLEVGAEERKPGLGFSMWWHLKALEVHAKSDHNEESQMIAECSVMGTLDSYVRVNPRWHVRSLKYWLERDEIEYHNMLVDFIMRQTASKGIL